MPPELGRLKANQKISGVADPSMASGVPCRQKCFRFASPDLGAGGMVLFGMERTESHAKSWWRPLAAAILAEHAAGRPTTLAAVGDLIARLGDDGMPDLAVPAASLGAALRAASGPRGGTRSRAPDRAKGGLARALWRHLRFAIGHDVSLTGLMLARMECTDAEFDVAEDLAVVLATLAGVRSGGADAWKRALGM
jgi:hypothetical protein